jgi:hypothetical protein
MEDENEFKDLKSEWKTIVVILVIIVLGILILSK